MQLRALEMQSEFRQASSDNGRQDSKLDDGM